LTRSRVGAELASVFLLLLAIVWRAGAWISPSALDSVGTLLGVVAGAIVLLSWGRRGVTLDVLGLAPRRFGAGLASALRVSGIGAIALIAAGVALGTASFDPARFEWLLRYLPGLFAQQILLQDFFAPGVRSLAASQPPRRRNVTTVIVATGLFAALHAPNLALMAGVSVAGAFWTAHFLAHRNLFAVVLSHLLLGTAAMVSLGPGPLGNLRVGPGALALLVR
jgi:hypothetical protein